MRSLAIRVSILGAFAAVCPLVHSATITPESLGCAIPVSSISETDCGFNTKTLADFKISSSSTIGGGNLALKNVNGWVGIGVTGGDAGGEIDAGQALNLSFFNDLNTINEITLGFLYANIPTWHDTIEVAGVTRINGGPGRHIGTLRLQDEYTATWSWGGQDRTITALSPGIITGGGVFRIDNPFCCNANGKPYSVTDLELYIPEGSPAGSDFALMSVNSTPEPGYSAILGLSLLSIAAFLRKRRA